MKNTTVVTLLIGMLILISACGEKTQDDQNGSPVSDAATSTQVSATESQSNTQAKVTLVKYSDYQCPACKYFHSFDHQLKEDFGDDVEIITKHFPLSIHPYAHLASRAAEAARKQGKFEEMHEMLFAGQEQWSRGNAEAIFIGYANSMGLDTEMFKTDMNSADMNRIVMADRREGRELGVGSTPTYFINGDELENNPSQYPAFKAIVQGYLDK